LAEGTPVKVSDPETMGVVGGVVGVVVVIVVVVVDEEPPFFPAWLMGSLVVEVEPPPPPELVPPPPPPPPEVVVVVVVFPPLAKAAFGSVMLPPKTVMAKKAQSFEEMLKWEQYFMVLGSLGFQFGLHEPAARCASL
jgi:hypothetical protein